MSSSSAGVKSSSAAGNLAVQLPAADQVQQLMARAAQQHAAGDLAAAEQSYRAVLALDPDHAAALADSGALAGQRGHPAQAAQYIARASALEPA